MSEPIQDPARLAEVERMNDQLHRDLAEVEVERDEWHSRFEDMKLNWQMACECITAHHAPGVLDINCPVCNATMPDLNATTEERLAEVERERDDWRRCASVRSGLIDRVERALDAAEARLAEVRAAAAAVDEAWDYSRPCMEVARAWFEKPVRPNLWQRLFRLRKVLAATTPTPASEGQEGASDG